jgi:hypothetical protein
VREGPGSARTGAIAVVREGPGSARTGAIAVVREGPGSARTGAIAVRLFAMDAFGTVLIAACVVAIVVAVVSYWGSGRLYRRIGVGELTMERERPARSVPGPGSEAEAREEIRQMLEAKSARREARGEPPLDVEAELAALTRGAPEHDPTLREEVRQLVIARNERRRRQGKEPLDVEAEIDRQLRALKG